MGGEMRMHACKAGELQQALLITRQVQQQPRLPSVNDQYFVERDAEQRWLPAAHGSLGQKLFDDITAGAGDGVAQESHVGGQVQAIAQGRHRVCTYRA